MRCQCDFRDSLKEFHSGIFQVMAIKFVLKQNGSRGRIQNNSAPVEYVFDGDIFTLGSDSANNIILDDSAAEQAVVVREGDQLTLMNSAAGTRLNGEDLRREAMHTLAAGDEIQVGDYTIFVVDTEKETAFVTQPLIPVQPEAEPAEIEENVAPEDALPAAEKTSSSFAAVLDTLRTEEDSFYFIVNTKDKKNGHAPLEQPEIPLGISERREIVFDIKQAATVFGVVRKNWSGIAVEAIRRGEILVNDEPIEAGTPRQLRNDDRVTFASVADASLILHEPSLLVALEPLISARAASNSGANLAAVEQASSPKSKPKAPLFERTFFGYFSFIEVLIMIIGTLIGAVLFFLLFEFMFA